MRTCLHGRHVGCGVVLRLMFGPHRLTILQHELHVHMQRPVDDDPVRTARTTSPELAAASVEPSPSTTAEIKQPISTSFVEYGLKTCVYDISAARCHCISPTYLAHSGLIRVHEAGLTALVTTVNSSTLTLQPSHGSAQVCSPQQMLQTTCAEPWL